MAWGTSATVDWKIGNNYSIKSITGFREYDTLSGQDNDGSPVAILQSLSQFSHRQFSQEICFNGEALGTLLEYTAGLIYFDQRTVYETRESDPFIPFGTDPFKRPIFDFIQNDTTNNTFKAGFLHTIWHLTDKMNLAAGIRRTKQDKSYEFFRLNVDGVNPFQPLSDPANPLNGRVGRYDGSHTDYRLNLDYQWTQDLMTYVQYSTGFKGGGISPRPYFPEQILGFGPEELNAYEFGWKSRFFNRKLQANGAVFYNDYKDTRPRRHSVWTSAEHPAAAVWNAGPVRPVSERGRRDREGRGARAGNLSGRAPSIDAAFSYLDFKFGTPKIQTTSVIAGRSAPASARTNGASACSTRFPSRRADRLRREWMSCTRRVTAAISRARPCRRTTPTSS